MGSPGDIVVSGGLWLALPIALAAGLLSFLSPCILPLVPGYLGYVSGVTAGAPRSRGRMVAGAGLFVAGFSTVFLAVFLLAGSVGLFFLQYRDVLLRVGGVVIILLGLVFIGQVTFLQRTIKPGWQPRAGLVGAPILGVIFAVGWTPCIGPTLTAVGFLAGYGGDPGRALLIGIAYCLGLGPSVPAGRPRVRLGRIVDGLVPQARPRAQHHRRCAADHHRPADGDRGLGHADDERRGGDRQCPHRPLSASRRIRTGRPTTSSPSRRVRRTPRSPQPKLGPIGFFRFVWRQLTSMRTALVLLLLLALASVPGSLVPQRSSDPNGVIQYQAAHPDTFPVLDGLGVFSTFTSPWFSAIYILLFVSLVGCIIPRTRHHLQALRARPPQTPARLQRLIGYSTATTGRGCRDRGRRRRARRSRASATGSNAMAIRSRPSAATCARPGT